MITDHWLTTVILPREGKGFCEFIVQGLQRTVKRIGNTNNNNGGCVIVSACARPSQGIGSLATDFLQATTHPKGSPGVETPWEKAPFEQIAAMDHQ